MATGWLYGVARVGAEGNTSAPTLKNAPIRFKVASYDVPTTTDSNGNYNVSLQYNANWAAWHGVLGTNPINVNAPYVNRNVWFSS